MHTKQFGITWKTGLDLQGSSKCGYHLSYGNKTSWSEFPSAYHCRMVRKSTNFWSGWPLLMRCRSLTATTNEKGGGRRALSWHKSSKSSSLQLGWETLMLPLYRPELVPSDYPLFLIMASNLRGENYSQEKLAEINCSRAFYERNIMTFKMAKIRTIKT